MSHVWFSLDFPSPLEAEAVLQFMRSLATRPRRGLLGTTEGVAFELVAEPNHVTWRMGVPVSQRSAVLGNLRAALPGVRTTDLDRRIVNVDAVYELRTNTGHRPLTSAEPEQIVAAVLGAVQDLHKGESVVLQLLVGPWLHRTPVKATPKTKRSTSWLDVGALVVDSEQAQSLRKKQQEPVFGCCLRLGIKARTTGRRLQLRQRSIGALQLLRAPGVGLERRMLPTWAVAARIERLTQPLIAWPCTLNAAELVAASAWPVGNPVVLGVTYSGGRLLPPPTMTKDIRVTGESLYPGRQHPVGISARDSLFHSVLLGPTGSGKSEVIASLAVQAATAGDSVIVLDPSVKADLVGSIAERLPDDVLDDLVIIDPRSATPVGFNPLVGGSDLAADTVLHILRELYASSWGSAVRTQDVLGHALLALARHGGLTLCELPPLLTNDAFRARVVARVARDDALGIGPFFHAFDQFSELERTQIVAPSLTRLRPLVTRPPLRAVLGQNPGFDLSTPFFKYKIVLACLAPGEVGAETATALGSLLLGQLYQAAQRRSSLPPERRRPVLMAIDEFHSTLRLPGSLSDSLSQFRGLGIGMLLAHQARHQLSPDVAKAVDANALTKIVWRLGHEDASVMAKVLGSGLTPGDLENLPRFESYQQLVVNGQPSAAASVATLPLGPPLRTYEAARRLSEQRYGKARSEVDADLLARRQEVVPEAPVGRRRKGATS